MTIFNKSLIVKMHEIIICETDNHKDKGSEFRK